MRTAVCLAGQARFISANANNILDNIILPTNADVFCHFWDTEGENLEPHRAVEVFNPISYSLEPQKFFDEQYWKYIKPEYFDFERYRNRYQTLHSMYYSIFKSNSLKQKHEQSQGFLYDCVIRCRTDIKFETPFDFSEFNQDPDAIWLCHFENSPAGGTACADLFAFTNTQRMDFYSSCFSNLPSLFETERHLFAETLLYQHLNPTCDVKLSKIKYSLVRA